MATTNTFTGASAVPFNPNTQSFGTTPTQTNSYSMGSVNLNTGVSTPAQQSTPVTPIQPATIPNQQNISTFGANKIELPKSTYQAPTASSVVNPIPSMLTSLTMQQGPQQQAANSISNQILSLIPNLQGESAALTQEQTNRNVPQLQQQLLDYNNQIIQKQAELAQDNVSLLAGQNNIQKQAIPMPFIVGSQNQMAKDAEITRALKMSEIGVIAAQAQAAQGNLSLALSQSQAAVDQKFQPYREAISLYQQQLQAIQPLLEGEQRQQAAQQQLLSQVYLKELDRQQANDQDMTNMIVTAASQGAPQSLISKAQLQSTPEGVASVLGAYAGDYYGTKIKIAQYNKLVSENAAAAQAVQAQGIGSGGAQANSQATFLLDTINGAMDLADASGRSAARRMFESWTTGATDYTNLESKVRTIKTNLLTLATDPNIKKFFGPQMSEADVKNMLSAASTLDSEAQTPAQMKSELSRVQSIFQKFAPDYKPAKVTLTSWAKGTTQAVTSTAPLVNFGFSDNQNK